MNIGTIVNKYGPTGAAQILKLGKSSIYRAMKKGGNINPRRKRVEPIWLFVKPEWLYKAVSVIAWSYRDEYNVEELKDYLLDFAYKTNLEKAHNPEGYLWKALQKKVWDFIRLRRHYNQPFEVVERWEKGWTESIVPLKK